MAGAAPQQSSKPTKKYSRKDVHKKDKPKLTKDDRRAKYTQLARDREGRRRRQLQSSTLVCYQCRQRGHAVADCPNNTTGGGDRKKKSHTIAPSRICFKCGSTEHSLSKCPKRNVGNADDLPFCHCFICNEKGHLSSKCPKNDHGIFVNGGECKNCGSNLHTSKNCPDREDLKKTKEKSVTGVPDIDPSSLLEGEGDHMPDLDAKKQKKKNEEQESKQKKTKRRVVNF